MDSKEDGSIDHRSDPGNVSGSSLVTTRTTLVTMGKGKYLNRTMQCHPTWLTLMFHQPTIMVDSGMFYHMLGSEYSAYNHHYCTLSVYHHDDG